MRIALVGKGGSGKTTVASMFIRYLKSMDKPVLAIDADINQHLGQALGYPLEIVKALPEVGNLVSNLKHILIGTNPLIPSPSVMIKTTLPGPGSHLIRLKDNDPILARFALRDSKNGYFMRVGGFVEEDLGVRCFHAKTGAAELILNHLMEMPDEFVVVDMTAGADAFASGLFTRFDLTLIVVEPTPKSLTVYEQYKSYAEPFGITIKAVGNKVEDEEDKAYLRKACGNDLLGFMGSSQWVRKTERGQDLDISDLEPENKQVLKQIHKLAADYQRDWKTYWEHGINFHNRNAESWANEDMKCDVRSHIDSVYLATLSPQTTGK